MRVSGQKRTSHQKYPHMTLKALEKLTDMKVRSAKPGPKNYKLANGGGLYLLVKTGGGR